jgi:hypothetical protein
MRLGAPGLAHFKGLFTLMSNSMEKKKEGFFAVDVRCFAESCANLNEAVCYLVLARGTGGDQVTTSWSVNAIEQRTSISRGRAGEAIQRLIDRGLVSKVAGGSKPRYKLVTWAQFTKLAPDPTPLSEEQEEVLDLIRHFQALSSKQKTIRNHLLRLNRVHLKRNDYGTYFEAIEPPEPRLAFIPNAFVSGAAGETPPLERLRRLQDPLLLRLIVDLYRIHLENDGGVAKTVIYGGYTREKKADFGSYAIYEFRYKSTMAYGAHEILQPHVSTLQPHVPEGFKWNGKPDMSAVWERFRKLESLGLIEWIPTLFEGAGPDAEPLFPLGHEGTDSIEDQLGQAAHGAAVRMLSRRYNLASDAPALQGPTAQCQLVPVYRDFEQATLVGIARLRYRPHTARTSLWLSKVSDRAGEYLEKWREIIDRVDLHARDDGYFDAA